jgi:outer membrane protein assembly factor BamA
VAMGLVFSHAVAGPFDSFTDPQDGQFDASEWLLDRKGFLPVPIIITEPAVGYGGGLAAVFFRGSLRESEERKGPSGEAIPPDIFTVAAAATENGTKFAGLGGIASFADDRWRYRGGIARLSANLDFYGVGGALGDDQRKIGYNLDGWFGMQQILYRLGTSNTWITGRWIYIDTESTFKIGNSDDTLLSGSALAKRSSGIGPTLEYDSRDNIFTPSRGWTGSLDLTFYDPSWGSSNRFQTYRGHVFAYWPFAKDFVLGGRIDGRSARGDVPFYMLPFVDLRGVPAARLQDENTGVVEAELRWNVTPRWALIGFAGAARAWGTRDGFGEAPTAVSKGAGFRYLIARRLGLYVGIDVAKSNYDHAFYIQVGNAWR